MPPPRGDLFELAQFVQCQQEDILNLKSQMAALLAALTQNNQSVSTNYRTQLRIQKRRIRESSERDSAPKLQEIALRLADKP